MIYIFDIDGTIADISHRLHFIQQEPKDWAGFFAACDDDAPIRDVIEVCNLLYRSGAQILLVSGRSDEVRPQTERWLEKHSVRFEALYMRKAGDHREDHVIKKEILDREVSGWRVRVNGVFEDRKQVVDMYRAKGLRVFQVAAGNF